MGVSAKEQPSDPDDERVELDDLAVAFVRARLPKPKGPTMKYEIWKGEGESSLHTADHPQREMLTRDLTLVSAFEADTYDLAKEVYEKWMEERSFLWWLRFVQDVSRELGVTLTADRAAEVLWKETGYPFHDHDHELEADKDRCRRELEAWGGKDAH